MSPGSFRPGEDTDAMPMAYDPDRTGTESHSSEIAPGVRLGAYRVEREISRGGMGAVYLASRDDDEFQQLVAIKVMHSGMASAESERRFRTERQILAALDHPNIARLLDAGSVSGTRPYLVMDFVDGQEVLSYCESRKLELEDRLRLFLKICAGVEYAHQHLVIHRDLKPANILVTAEGEPKLLDFGIAKLTDMDQEATTTAATMFSPLYASPEQLGGGAVTTATDIYSLGVLLYEMVTGERPYRLQETSNAELAAAILRQEPTRPSAHRRLPTDIDAIVMKALRKNPADRYGMVEQFSGDIERYLDRRPVSARKGHWTYPAKRFLQRNKVAAGVAGMALVAGMAGVGSTVFQARRANRRFQEVRQLANYLVYDFHDAVSKLPGSTRLQKEVVERSMQYLDRLASESGGNAELETDLAEAYLKLGDVLGSPFQNSLRDTGRAIESYRKAERAAAMAAGSRGRDFEAESLLARARIRYGSTLTYSRSGDDAIGKLREGLELQRRLASEHPEDAQAQIELGRGRDLLSRALSQEGGFETEGGSGEATRLVETALRDVDEALRRHPGHEGLLRTKATLHVRIGAQLGTADPARSGAAYERAFQALEAVRGRDRESTAFRRQLAALYGDRGWPAAQMGRFDEGIALYDKACELVEKIVREDPADASSQAALTAVYRERGIIHGYANHTTLAIADFERAAELHKQLLEHDPEHLVYGVMRGELLGRIGRLQMTLGRNQEARANLKESLRVLLTLAERPNPEANHVLEACKALETVPVAELQDRKRALALCQSAVEATKGKSMFAWEALGHARLAVGDRAGAIEAYERTLGLIAPQEPNQPKSRARMALEKLIEKTRRGKG